MPREWCWLGVVQMEKFVGKNIKGVDQGKNYENLLPPPPPKKLTGKTAKEDQSKNFENFELTPPDLKKSEHLCI